MESRESGVKRRGGSVKKGGVNICENPMLAMPPQNASFSIDLT